MKPPLTRLFGLVVLTALLAGIGSRVVPAHWTSLWFDREFSGWVAPIANRLDNGARLYEDPLHSPMPPLSFLLMRALYPRGATWISESFVHFLFQAGTLLLLYWCFSARVPWSVALAATLGSIPVFFAFPKVVLYDAMAQFLVAAIGGTTLAYVVSQQRPGTPGHFAPRDRGLLVLLGFELALLLLTKQSTGAGAVLGVAAVLGWAQSGREFKVAVGRMAWVGGVMVVSGALVVCATQRWVNPIGLLQDVFLSGAEPKGGSVRLFRNFATYLAQNALVVGAFYLLYRVCKSIFDRGGGNGTLPGGDAPPSGKSQLRLALAACLGFLAGSLAAFIVAQSGVSLMPVDRAWPTVLLHAGLAGCLVSVVVFLFRLPAWGGLHIVRSVMPLTVVFLFSAWFHCLSVKQFYWTYSNSPLIVSALVFVFAVLARRGAVPGRNREWQDAVLTGAAVGLMALAAVEQIATLRQCTAVWPEIRHLAGARLRPQAEGMRALVRLARELADPAKGDEVLLLPNDPNVEAWFERPRPALSSAIVFVDQYWDRFVDADFERLKARPPKVIIIGPRDTWRAFSRKWNVNWGTERLIDRLRHELLPGHYRLYIEHPIQYQERPEIMDVFVRHHE